jgi:hypothetical protein
VISSARARIDSGEVERLGGPEVDQEREFGGLLDRNIGRPGARAGPCGHLGGPTVQIGSAPWEIKPPSVALSRIPCMTGKCAASASALTRVAFVVTIDSVLA